uniref:Uncharacterized protein n=1 Tax=Anguilla anguilla TaxID=7936 RepID=A0A0E9SS23_ANGAN
MPALSVVILLLRYGSQTKHGLCAGTPCPLPAVHK